MKFNLNTSVGNAVKQDYWANKLLIKREYTALTQDKDRKFDNKAIQTTKNIGYPHVLSEEVELAKRAGQINGKLYCGETLTEEDLLFLKANSPESYQKAVEVIRERKAFREELKKANSKEEASNIGSRKMNALSKELKAANGNISAEMQITTRINNMSKEYSQFIGSKRYKSLPDTYKEAIALRKEKEKYEGEKLPDLDMVAAQKVEYSKTSAEKGVMYDASGAKPFSTNGEGSIVDTLL